MKDIIIQLALETTLNASYNLVATSIPHHYTCSTDNLGHGATSSVCIYPKLIVGLLDFF